MEMFEKSEMKDEEKIETAKIFIEELHGYYQDSSHAPMDPHVYFDIETGEISIQSALSPHDDSDLQIGRMEDLYDWYSVTRFEPSEYTDDDLCSVWDQTYDSAEETIDQIEE